MVITLIEFIDRYQRMPKDSSGNPREVEHFALLKSLLYKKRLKILSSDEKALLAEVEVRVERFRACKKFDSKRDDFSRDLIIFINKHRRLPWQKNGTPPSETRLCVKFLLLKPDKDFALLSEIYDLFVALKIEKRLSFAMESKFLKAKSALASAQVAS